MRVRAKKEYKHGADIWNFTNYYEQGKIYEYEFTNGTYKVFTNGTNFGGYVPFHKSAFDEYFITLDDERNLKIESALN